MAPGRFPRARASGLAFAHPVGSLPAQELEAFPLFSAYSLIQWTLAGKTQGEGYGFTF